MMGMVLDIETRVDAGALRNTRRRAAPRGMPTGLQTVAAAAMLAFLINDQGICDNFLLTSVDRKAAGEPALVTAIERKLGVLADEKGTLVTFNGTHDLGIVRLAAARHRRFEQAASARWLRSDAGRHEDIMLEFSAGGRQTWPRLDDLAASFGITSAREMILTGATPSAERMKCELDVVVTMMLYLHVLAERTRSIAPVARGTDALMAMMEERIDNSPHFQAAMRGHAFSVAAKY